MRHAYDLHYYYTDTKSIPRLSGEEAPQLLALLASAATTQPVPLAQVTRAKHRLIEGHLGLASAIAISECPPALSRALPDLLQEASLALIEAAHCFEYTSGGNFTAYVASYVHGRVKHAIGNENLLGIPSYVWTYARKTGKMEQLRALLPVSLDCLLDEEDEESSLLATLVAPALPQTPPPRNDEQRAQVEGLLAYLSPRAETVLRLRYGLVAEDDERPRSIEEIAHELGTTRNAVRTTELDALRRLRALVTGQARIVRRRGRLCISLSSTGAHALAQERQDLLLRAFYHFQEQGVKITVDRLAETTGLPKKLVATFLRQQRGVCSTLAGRQQARQQRLQEAYAQLVAAGKTPTRYALARLAHVNRKAARSFLQACQEQRRQPAAQGVCYVY